jgi:hypothetical protein
MTATAKRLLTSPALALVLAGACVIALLVFGDGAQIMREVTSSDELGAEGGEMEDEVGNLWATVDRLTDWGVAISVIGSSVTLLGCALAMNVGGGRRVMPVAMAAGGAPIVAVLAMVIAD